MRFVANFIRFQQCRNFENRLRFDKVTAFKGGNFFETQCIYDIWQNIPQTVSKIGI